MEFFKNLNKRMKMPKIMSKPSTQEYRDNYDKIFKKQNNIITKGNFPGSISVGWNRLTEEKDRSIK